jgi:hypothetical protein
MIDFSHLYVCCEIAKQQKNIAPVKNVFVQCELFLGKISRLALAVPQINTLVIRK